MQWQQSIRYVVYEPYRNHFHWGTFHKILTCIRFFTYCTQFAFNFKCDVWLRSFQTMNPISCLAFALSYSLPEDTMSQFSNILIFSVNPNLRHCLHVFPSPFMTLLAYLIFSPYPSCNILTAHTLNTLNSLPKRFEIYERYVKISYNLNKRIFERHHSAIFLTIHCWKYPVFPLE